MVKLKKINHLRKPVKEDGRQYLCEYCGMFFVSCIHTIYRDFLGSKGTWSYVDNHDIKQAVGIDDLESMYLIEREDDDGDGIEEG